MTRFAWRRAVWTATCLVVLAGSLATCRPALAQLFGPPPAQSPEGNPYPAGPAGGYPPAASPPGGGPWGGPNYAMPGAPAGGPYSAPPSAGGPGPVPAATPQTEVLEGAQVMARVADQFILAADILSRVDLILRENKDKIPPSAWDEQRLRLAQQALKVAVESKLVVVDALKSIPAANLPELEKRVNEQFETEQVKRLMKSLEATSRAELEAKLLARGSSLDQQRRIYFERSLAAQWLRQKIDGSKEKDVSHAEMLDYYQAHLRDYEHPARVRWEQLSLRFDRARSKQEAYATLARLGNDVLRGAPLAQVARAESQGPTAGAGGQWDWTSQGSLASQPLDQALFSLPVGALSSIVEDDQAFHIVRVIERADADRTPFRDAQVKIREELEKDRGNKAAEAYYERLRKEIRVWTVFDDPLAAQRFAASIKTRATR